MSFSSSGKRFFSQKTSLYRISSSQITHFKTRIKTSGAYLAGDPPFFSILLGKKHCPPPVYTCRQGWRGVRVGWVGWFAGFAGLLGKII